MQYIEPTNKDFLTPKKLEAEFGISIIRQSRMRMRKNQNQTNSLPFIKLGKLILYKRNEIEKWLDSNSKGANMGNFGFEDYFKQGENHKAQNTLNLVKDILSECDKLCQQDLASKIKRKIEQDYIEIVGRNALWKLLDKYKGILWEITYEPQERGGKRKILKLKREFKQ